MYKLNSLWPDMHMRIHIYLIVLSDYDIYINVSAYESALAIRTSPGKSDRPHKAYTIFKYFICSIC